MLEGIRRVHFIGIGGIGVSAVARIAIGRGYEVSGSDVRRSQLTDAMQELGATVFIGHAPENLDGVDLVVLSTAIPEHNVERVEAAKRGTATIHRSELLAGFISSAPCAIGVTGTHGKGTTSAMITCLLDAGEREPGFIIGGILNNYGLNARYGAGTVLVAEVDESDGSHRNVPVHHLVCNFLEADHLNYYRDLDDIITTMADAVISYPALDALYVNADCDGNRRLIDIVGDRRRVVTYGLESADADYRAEIVSGPGLPIRFNASRHGEPLGVFELPIPGRYNVVNAMGAIAVCDRLGVPVEAMQRGMAGFLGLENRFTIREADGVFIVKDYNSHPTAMRHVLQNARELGDGRIISVFKPYRYTLMNYLRDEYATAFVGSDEVVITTMYAANEDPIPGVSTESFVEMLREGGQRVTWLEDQDTVTDHLEAGVRPGDVVLFFGGDDFFRMADAWAARRDEAAARRR